MSLPIPGCSFTLSLILFNISFGLLCSDPVQPISAAEGADKSIPPVMDRPASAPAELAAELPPCLAAPARSPLPLPGGQTPAPPRSRPCRQHACTQRRAGARKVRCYLLRGLLSPGKGRQTHNKL